MADAACHMTFAHARRTEDQAGGTLVDPGVAAGQRHDMRLGQHRHLGKVEAGQCLGHVELRVGAVALDAPLGPLGDFVLQQATQEPGRRPALLV